MLHRLNKFLRSQSGAVTVDWVVLTAAVVGLAVMVVVGISGSSESVGDGIGSYLTSVEAGN